MTIFLFILILVFTFVGLVIFEAIVDYFNRRSDARTLSDRLDREIQDFYRDNRDNPNPFGNPKNNLI